MSNAEYRQGYEVGQADMKQDGITVAEALDVLRAAGWTVETHEGQETDLDGRPTRPPYAWTEARSPWREVSDGA